MSIIVLTPPTELKRSDRRNLFVLSAANAAAAKSRAEAMCGDSAGAFNGWTATTLTDSAAQDFIAELSGTPIGLKEGNVWPRLTSAGAPLSI